MREYFSAGTLGHNIKDAVADKMRGEVAFLCAVCEAHGTLTIRHTNFYRYTKNTQSELVNAAQGIIFVAGIL